MARELSDPDIASAASSIVMRGQPGQIAPRGPIKPTAPDEGPLMNPSTNMVPTTPSTTATGSPQMYIPGGSMHEVIHMDPGQDDRVIDYPVGTGAWQSRAHDGHVPPADGPDGTTGSSKPVNVPAVPTTTVRSA